MNKPIIYTVLLFCTIGAFIFFSSYKGDSKNIILERNGLQFTKADINDILSFGRQDLVFIISEKDEKHIYKLTGYKHGNRPILFLHKTRDLDKSNDDFFLEAINGQLIFQDTTPNPEMQHLFDLVLNASNLEARELLQYTREPGLFGYIDDSPFIFLFISIIPFFFLLLMDEIIRFLEKKVSKQVRIPIHLGILVLAILFFSNLRIVSWVPHSYYALLVRNGITLLGAYALFQYLKTKFYDQFDFYDGELAKFITLLLSTVLLFILGNRIGFQVDSYQFEKIFQQSFWESPNLLVLAFIFAFTLGNLLNNIRKHLRYLGENEKLLHQSQNEVLETRAELQALQASINPHFLYNALNSIASLAKKDGDKTEKMAISLSQFYQYVTNRENKYISSVEAEIDMLDNYLDIEQIRFGNKLEVNMHYADEALPAKLPRFVLQPIVENAIKYGFNDENISVEINVGLQNDKLEIKIFDGGKAFDEQLSLGYGLKSVSKKLKLLYPGKHELAFINSPKKHVFISIDQN